MILTNRRITQGAASCCVGTSRGIVDAREVVVAREFQLSWGDLRSYGLRSLSTSIIGERWRKHITFMHIHLNIFNITIQSISTYISYCIDIYLHIVYIYIYIYIRYQRSWSQINCNNDPRPGHMDPREASGGGFNPTKLGATLCLKWESWIYWLIWFMLYFTFLQSFF